MAHQQAQEPSGDRLRLVAALSAVALAAVLPLAVATAGPYDPYGPYDRGRHGQAGHSEPQDGPGRSGSPGVRSTADGD
jgi:hypothetical protein